ncbi:MAG: hypothetical protein H0W76_12230 [Pyrinomonadaceae bacterium]|nr:hypothetical protein [Pyrinomonadaceae bacterium]
MIYYPHPETKPMHFRPVDVLEVMTLDVEGLSYGAELMIKLDRAQIKISV